MKKSVFIYIFLLIFSTLLVVGCDDDETGITMTALAITPSSVPALPVGETQKFTATGTWSDGSIQDNSTIVTWITSDSSVVTVDATGLAATRAEGSANISASFGVTSNTVAMVVDPAAAPPPTDTGDYNEGNVCNAEFCATDDALSQTCSTFLAACIAAVGDVRTEECVAGGLVICQNPDSGPGIVCDYGLCATDQTLHDQCTAFMGLCVDESANAEECVGAMLFFCRPEE